MRAEGHNAMPIRATSKRMLFAAATLILAWPGTSRAGDDDDPYCGMLPDAVIQSESDAGWSACALRELGEMPLWRALPGRTRQVMRFTFTEGHGRFTRVVTLREREDGTAVLTVAGMRHGHRAIRQNMRRRQFQLSATAMDHVDRLASDTGAWAFDVGTWDRIADEDGERMEIFMHCQLLEMERADASGYRFSSVNIGCNQPGRLMPLVDEIVRLGRLEVTHGGMLFE